MQAYVYSAYLARAHFAREAGDEATFERFRSKATSLKTEFNRDFWLEERGWFAVGLDADKRPIDSLTSNIGHCLWTGIVDQDKARIVADKLMSPEMNSGWGVRTLATSMGGYNPISYHCGSVWPHDTAIVAAGLARYGFMDDALRLDLRAARRGVEPRGAAARALLRAGPLASSRLRSATRRRARPRRGRRRRRCCACGRCSVSTRGSPTARRGCRRCCPRG